MCYLDWKFVCCKNQFILVYWMWFLTLLMFSSFCLVGCLSLNEHLGVHLFYLFSL